MQKNSNGRTLVWIVLFAILLEGTETAILKEDVRTNSSSLHYAISCSRADVVPKLTTTTTEYKSFQNAASVKEPADLFVDLSVFNFISASPYLEPLASPPTISQPQTVLPQRIQASSRPIDNFDFVAYLANTISDLIQNSAIPPDSAFRQLKKTNKLIRFFKTPLGSKNEVVNTEISTPGGYLSAESDAALQNKLMDILQLGQSVSCQLIIVYDATFEETSVFQSLLRLPRPKLVRLSPCIK